MRKAISMVFCLSLVAAAAVAQVKTPQPSPKASLTQTVGTTDITIHYSRPGVKGRTIWGDLVPHDKVWRTGANAATTISFSDDVTINGQKLAKGTYSLHTIPGKDEWTIIFNTVADQWGSYSYDAAKDALRVTTKPEKSNEFAEWMGFDIPKMTTDEATIRFRWENVAVPFTVNTNTTTRTLAAFRSALGADWRTPYMAANFAFENKAGTPEEMNKWVDMSIKVNENLANLWLKARMQERAGDRAAAIATAEKAISKATEAQKDFAGEVRRISDGWRK